MKKDFKGKIIEIRKFSGKDGKRVKDFLIHTNSLIEEGAKLLMNKRKTLKEVEIWLLKKANAVQKRKEVFLIAECDKKIVGKVMVRSREGVESHVAELFGITIIDGYRRIGLGKYLMKEIIELSLKELKDKPKIIRLNVFQNNKPAIGLYEKMGFKIIAQVPKQIQYKGKLVDEVIMIKFIK